MTSITCRLVSMIPPELPLNRVLQPTVTNASPARPISPGRLG